MSKIYREKVIGAQSNRHRVLKMLDSLDTGDVAAVTRIHRLARSAFDSFGVVKRITDARSQFWSLAERWAETGISTRRWMQAVLGALPDVERELIRTRTVEVRNRAKKRGQHMGRSPRWTEAQKGDARRRRAEGATLSEFARSSGVSESTISRVTTRWRCARR